MDGVPDRIEPENLVGEKFGQRSERADRQYPWIGERIEHLKIFRQADPLQPHRETGDEDGQI